MVTLNASSVSIARSNTITLTATVRNTGERSSASTTLRWSLSTDSTLDPNDTPLGTHALSSLSSGDRRTETISTTVPNTPGTYYYGVCVDRVAGETDPNDNCSSVVRVVVTVPGLDLVVTLSASKTNVLPSETITLTAIVRNIGIKMADSTVLRWYRSTDSTLALTTDNVRSLEGATSLTISNTITVSSNSGTYTYYACVDSLTNEYDPNNNCSSAVRILVSTHPHLPRSDFTTLSTAGNRYPHGIWSDGTTLWVVDERDAKLFAYDLATKARVPAQDFTTLAVAGNMDPSGIWSDGTTLWVADERDAKLYAYSMSNKARDPTKDFTNLRAIANINPQGIWSDGIIMWVVDRYYDQVLAYSMSNKAHILTEGFNLAAGNRDPSGLWSDGTTLWVADERNTKLYAYSMSNKALVPAQDFTTLSAAGNTLPTGLWSDGSTMWVADYHKRQALRLRCAAFDKPKLA